MRANDKITCPACGETSMAKLKPRLDGFTPVGEELVCMLCGASLGAPETDEAVDASATEKLHNLGLLLGAAPVAPVRLAAATAETHFCKDCIHFVAHPYGARCALDRHSVEAMADCPHYAARQA